MLKVKKIPQTCLLSMLLLTAGCRPEGVIPPEDMETLFRSFYLADARIELAREAGTAVSDSLRVYLPIVEQMGYTEEDFRLSMTYYLHHPAKLSQMFERIGRNLEKEAGGTEQEEDSADAGPDAVQIREGAEPSAEMVEAVEMPADRQKKKAKRRSKRVSDRPEEEAH